MEKDVSVAIICIKDAEFPTGICCANCCRDCRYIEMDNDFWNDGTRRCSYKGIWVRPSSVACGNFEP